MSLGVEKAGLLNERRGTHACPSGTATTLLFQAVHLCSGDVISAEPSAHDAPLVMSA